MNLIPKFIKKPLLIIYRTFIYPIPYKKYYFTKKLKKDHETKTILFYPDKPVSFHIIYKICHILGYKITNNHKVKADLVIKFEDRTYSAPNEIMLALSNKYEILNLDCTDISKETVDRVFKKIFGYCLNVDPQKQVKYVRKSNGNATHDGIIFNVLTKPKKGYVYQNIINNQYGHLVKDIRVPVLNKTIPFVYYKYRNINNRFSNTNVRTEMVQTDKEFSSAEVDKILDFIIQMGLDIGELDVLRDRDSGKIYIVDVSNTPYGPPNHIKKDEYKKALRILSNTFKENYLVNT